MLNVRRRRSSVGRFCDGGGQWSRRGEWLAGRAITALPGKRDGQDVDDADVSAVDLGVISGGTVMTRLSIIVPERRPRRPVVTNSPRSSSVYVIVGRWIVLDVVPNARRFREEPAADWASCPLMSDR